MVSPVEAVATELAARRLASLSGTTADKREDANFWSRAIDDALPDELKASSNYSNILGVAFETSYFFLHKDGFVHGSDLSHWKRFASSNGWTRYVEDEVTLDTFVVPFPGGFAAAGSFAVSSPKRWIRLTDPKMASRILYPNPLCIVTAGEDYCMTLSWLTLAGNDGTFVFSMNTTRRTANPVCLERSPFKLSIMAAGSEPLLLDVGSRTPGKRERADCDENGYVKSAVARIAARVDAILDKSRGHYVARALIEEAHVLSWYWVDGKLFAPDSPTAPSLLSFLGSKQFANVRRQ